MDKQRIPLVVANLMNEYDDAELLDAPGEDVADQDMPGGHGVDDGVSDASGTQMRSCAAANCAHNVEGQRCELDQIEINQYGGCADYEAAASGVLGEFDDRKADDLDFDNSNEERDEDSRYEAIDTMGNGVPDEL